MCWILITKTTMFVIFNLQNSHLLTLSLPTEEVFQVNGQNQPVANLPVVDFHSLIRILRFFFLYIGSFSPFRKVWTSLSFIDTDFLSVLAAIIRESSDKLLCAENREGFAVYSSTSLSGAKGEWRISSWLAISTHVKKYDVFSRLLLRLFSGPEIFVYHLT